MPEISVFQRLRERKLVQWGLAWVAAAWLLLEILGHAGATFGWPDAVDRIGLIVAGFGFLVVLVLAWYHGDMGKQRISGPELLIIALLLAIGGGVVSILRPGGEEDPTPRSAAVDPEKPSLALFPCDNHSPNPDDAYLAPGIHEEFLSMLEKISGLTSMGRKSVEAYLDDPRPLPEKAAELGVAYVGECSVMKAPDSEEVRISVRLLDAEGVGVWGDTFDRDMGAAGYFEMLSDVARQFAAGLGAFLTPAEESLLAVRPTENSDAYELYLRGRDYYVRPLFRDENFAIAEDFWARAIELDPEFALARAKLSFLHGRTAYLGYDRDPARLEAQEREAAEALRLQPDLPEALFARGYVAYVQGDLNGALEGFRLAQEGAPNDPVTAAFTGYAHRRLGAWEDWERTWRRTLELNPRNVDMYYNLGARTLWNLNRFQEALEALDRALELAPDLYEAVVRRGFIYADWQGQSDTLRAVLQSLPEDQAIGNRLTLALWDRDPEGIVRWAEAGSEIRTSQSSIGSRHLMLAQAHRLRGDEEAARAALALARDQLQNLLSENPDDYRIHYGLGMAYAGLGLRDEAVRSVERYLRGSPYPPEDVLFGSGLAQQAAQVFAQAGLAEEAIGLLSTAYGTQRVPGRVRGAHAGFRFHPIWDPIRGHPDFQAFLEESGAESTAPDSAL